MVPAAVPTRTPAESENRGAAGMGALGENLFNQICGNTHGGRAEQPHQCRKPSCIAQNCPAHGAEVPDFMPTEVLGGPPGEVESRGRGRRCDAVHPRDLRPYVWGSHGYRGLCSGATRGAERGVDATTASRRRVLRPIPTAPGLADVEFLDNEGKTKHSKANVSRSGMWAAG